MSRRRQIDYDYDDYCDEDDYYEEEEEEPERDANASQYMWRGSSEATAQHESDAHAQSALLDSLAEEFRACLGDVRIPRDQIDAVLVAADYDVDSAMQMMREQLSASERLLAAAAARLESADPSPIARMLEDAEAVHAPTPSLPEAPCTPTREPQSQVPPPFAFDVPSPDDIVREKQYAGQVRAQLATKGTASKSAKPASVKKLPGGTLDVSGAGKRQAKSESKSAQVARPGAKVSAQSSTGESSQAARATAPDAPKQRQRQVKFPPAGKLATRSPSVAIVVAGHVDAGKSTLVGHILRLVGEVTLNPGRAGKGEGKLRPGASSKRGSGPNSRVENALAWTTDEDQVEQERGVTIDIATRVFGSASSNKLFTMIDAPGHRDYVPAMILGACQASAAILVVDTSIGEFESGFSEEGQTREHAVLLRSLGIGRLVVVLNKMDMVDYSQSRFDEICKELTGYLKNLGWTAGKDVVFVPASGASGVNLVDQPAEDTCATLASWYKGDTVMGALEALPTARSKEIATAMAQPTRLVVSDAFRSSTLGGVIAVSGRLVSGTVAAKDTLRLCPTTEVAVVKSIEVGSEARSGENGYAVAAADSLPVSLGLTGIADTTIISAGDVLCDPQAPVPTASRFRAQVLTLATPVPLVQGVQVELHLGGVCEAAVISKLIELKTGAAEPPGGKKKKAPRMLVKGVGAVVEVTASRPICVERAVDAKFLGRFALRCHGKTVAAGVVTKVLKQKKSKAAASAGGSGGNENSTEVVT